MVDYRVLTIHLLGGFRFAAGDKGVVSLDHARLQELVAHLLLQRDSPASRQHLAFRFWPDSTEKQARTNLRNLWHRLRRTLPEAERFLAADGLTIRWRIDPTCWLDVAEFETHLQQAGQASDVDVQIQHLEQAVALYGGDLLSGMYSDWLLIKREQLAQAYAGALERLAALHEARSDYSRVIGYVQAMLRHDPLTEPAYARLMRLHALNNDRAAALHTYHICAAILRRELDVEPDCAIRALYEQLLNQAPMPVASQIETTAPMVGRRAEWVQIQNAWRKAVVKPQFVLIAGEAGIGKTRLARELAEWVGRKGVPVLTAHCHAAGGDLAYAPVATWLRSRPRAALDDAWLRELTRLLPEILVERPGLPPAAPLTEGCQRLHFFEALAHEILSNRSSLLLFLDDIQWCF